ncbi:hypothetical protein PFISCL1PPCAC_20833 [Pristionchus fissidentatus]|uniref:E3 ubiquitin-protein ligase ZNRF1 n=1 Tax=Pristionchus fissidentatus TaxID=1538716 RepID=A0AAV5WBA4_9BILA|nr:hypothetical protein PFISCL1PPCAC_20833 [Pristionchus fissidentatus]
MGARQSMDERPRSNSVDTASSGGMAGLGGGRLGEPRGASRSVLSTTDIVHAMRRAEESLRGDGSDDDDDTQPGPSRPPLYPRDGQSRRSHPSSSSSHQRRQLRQHMRRSFFMLDLDCPICKKRVPSDEADVHLVMCLTRPKITYNEDILSEAKGECSICLEEMEGGATIARLPCLCIYHKDCIDDWFKRKNCCPEHPGDD